MKFSIEAKISVTTRCNAHCVTCPVWECQAEHGADMSFDEFRVIFDKLNQSPNICKIMLNGTGDLYLLPDHRRMLEYIEQAPKMSGKVIAMTTNGAALDYIPAIDHLVISFNGGTREIYEKTTGLSFDQTVENIRRLYPDMRKCRRVEIHHLCYSGNAGDEKDFYRLWQDFPGFLRLSYKYDNQHRDDLTIDSMKSDKRTRCDYLDKLVILPGGRVHFCNHDFKHETVYGNILEQDIVSLFRHPDLVMKRLEHDKKQFKGICENCNYNTPDAPGKIFYIKEGDF